ncbi:metal ABC transporter substrate-binding protein [Carboxylicivirga sp. RSCT41]|uniref:metal ABC transporter substrate-binding protein n=1 Tax=Carboxylicivirga agarovorans TaxID=3417570 RepID=UPI003D330024
MKHIVYLLLTLSLSACFSKKGNEQAQAPSKPVITAVNYPLYYFTERIGGDYVDLKYTIPSDVDPAYWIPDSESLTLIQECDVLFTNGADYAKWLNNVSIPERIKVNTTAGLKDEYIEIKIGQAHSHGDGEEHVHTGLAFTTWLDLSIAMRQAEAIKDKLVELCPDKKSEIEANFAGLKTDLKSLDGQLKNIQSDAVLIGSHPVYQYLASAYHLEIYNVHFEPNELPSNKQWHELDHLLDHYPAAMMIWEAEPLPQIKEELEKRKVAVIVYSPVGNKPVEGNFLSVMQSNVKELSSQLY